MKFVDLSKLFSKKSEQTRQLRAELTAQKTKTKKVKDKLDDTTLELDELLDKLKEGNGNV